MLQTDWDRRVEWARAMGLTVDQAIRAADRAAEREEMVRQARDRRFNEYGMPRDTQALTANKTV